MATNGQHGQATASEDVFLSPRVVDREAFDNFSDVLRAIVDDAQVVGQTIEAKSSLAKRALAEFARSEPTMNASIDTAARVLKSMDERIDRIETLLGRAEEMSGRLDEKSTRATQHLDEREASLRAVVSDLIAQAEARLNTSAIETTTRVEDVLRSTERALDQAREDAGAMHAETLRQLTDLSDRLAGEIADTAAEGRGQLRETMDKLEAEIEPARSRIEATTADLEERLDRLRKQTLALMGPGVRQLESLCQRGSNLLGRDPEFIESEPTEAAEAGSLADIVSRGEALGERAETASQRLESIRTQAESSRKELAESIISSSEWLDKLLEYQASLDGATAESVERCREAETALKQREEELRESLLEPAQTIEREIQRIDELMQNVRASRVEAETLFARHQQVAQEAKEDLERLEEMIARAGRASTEMTPPTELGADSSPNATAALTDAVEAIKGELSGELGKMTRAIEMMMRSSGAASGAAVEPEATNKPSPTGTPSPDSD
jgi:chromosome segregation ATPase